jgi:PQQ-like domain
VVNGVVYVQDLESNVTAISLATGKVLWTHTYSSPNGGPDGVTVANGVVYGATNHAAFALSAASGRQLWIRTLIGNGLSAALRAGKGKRPGAAPRKKPPRDAPHSPLGKASSLGGVYPTLRLPARSQHPHAVARCAAVRAPKTRPAGRDRVGVAKVCAAEGTC